MATEPTIDVPSAVADAVDLTLAVADAVDLTLAYRQSLVIEPHQRAGVEQVLNTERPIIR
jgi:hypothetical protein